MSEEQGSDKAELDTLNEQKTRLQADKFELEQKFDLEVQFKLDVYESKFSDLEAKLQLKMDEVDQLGVKLQNQNQECNKLEQEKGDLETKLHTMKLTLLDHESVRPEIIDWVFVVV